MLIYKTEVHYYKNEEEAFEHSKEMILNGFESREVEIYKNGFIEIEYLKDCEVIIK